jgi:hypothetical protein
MSLTSRIVARLAGLPPARTHAVAVERGLRVPMPDGATLLADHYSPRGGGHEPIVLIRSPYGRAVFGIFGRIFAERGYQVVVQSVRGTFGSGGEFDAMRNEARDGRATLDWLAAQAWFVPNVGMSGPSYLGFVQWAVATGAPPYLKALAAQITASQFRSLTYPGESYALDTGISWTYLLHHQEMPWWRIQWAALRQRRALLPAFAAVPLAKADELAVGHRVKFYQDWLAHNTPGEPFWEDIDFSHHLDAVTAPVNLVAGWYDIFLPEQLADYAALRRAGRPVRLTVGPWMHSSLGVLGAALRESLTWFDAYLRDEPPRAPAKPVRIHVMGGGGWRDLAAWPPSATATRWYLGERRTLGPTPTNGDAPPDGYRYDPANPTPAVGGIVLGAHGGPRDNRRLEARPDVLVYTGAPLSADLEVIGPVAAELYVRSSLEHTDFFARLCDVAPNGRSVNVCDGLLRLWPGRCAPAADGTMKIHVDLWPTAYRFTRGHRLRLQVSSGAHPRFARNLGSGEPLGTAITFRAADQEVYLDAAHPSAVILPVAGATPSAE